MQANDQHQKVPWTRHHIVMVVLNVPMLILGICELVMGSLCFSFSSNTKVGAFYAGAISVVTGLIGLAFFNSFVKFLYLALVVLACLVNLIGCMVDGIYYAAPIGFISACGNDDGKLWGDSDYYDKLLNDCDEILFEDGNFDCYCVTTGSSNDKCYHYDGEDGFDANNCGPVTDEWGRWLHASWSLCLAMFFYTWILFAAGIANERIASILIC